MSDVKTLLITGAGGDLGTRMRRLLKDAYRLRLTDFKRPTNLTSDEEFVQADLADISALEKAVAGVDGIVHFGGFSVEGPWPVILNANIIGCYNLFDVAHSNGVKRVVFASSNHAIGFYPRRRRIGVNEPVRPDSVTG